ncbi:hypothetical protein FHS83_001842 [Rhizomicrobium palustre]|uniref:Acyl carrier protein n=1 Tax=Rhizomicrobium palustre TaxID=189966 RepID=A0A846MY30_9PROT|nr:hypothetical protein [Rhizomicrobium palustre]NIK88524.1 hypothetical protein [Rhizomicrobium palustre]
MELYNLFARFSLEFEVDFPQDASETMLTVKDVRDFVRREYVREGIECSAGVIFDRITRLMAILLRVDVMSVRPETRFADLLRRPAA